ncbi:MAG TPA: steroid delta-isomerase [Deltaproteobacteria bacterium]|jgi:steroid delta-isomerase|nr:steroid delta-isomerase [Deltaproteobacteria bacterium]
MSEHPAITAAHSSWRCVQTRKRQEWLALLADDVTIEDPIGVAPTNPTGKGFRGREEAARFWDNTIGPTQSITIEAHESFAAGNESAHVLTLTMTFPNHVRMQVHGIFTYAVDDTGRIKSLRGYWALGDAKIEKPASG